MYWIVKKSISAHLCWLIGIARGLLWHGARLEEICHISLNPALLALAPEVAEVTFSDSDSTLVPKFLNPGPDPGPAIFQISESDSCLDSGYNYQSNRNLPMFLLKKCPHSCYCRNWKVAPDPGLVFAKFLTPGPKEKRRILPESTPVLRIESHLCLAPRDMYLRCIRKEISIGVDPDYNEFLWISIRVELILFGDN